MRKRIQKIQLKVNLLQDRHPYLEDIRGHLKVLTLRDPLQCFKANPFYINFRLDPRVLLPYQLFQFLGRLIKHSPKNKSITNIFKATSNICRWWSLTKHTGPHSGGLRWALMSWHFRIKFTQNHLAKFNWANKKNKKQPKQLADG